jgi:hypothetical protein
MRPLSFNAKIPDLWARSLTEGSALKNPGSIGVSLDHHHNSQEYRIVLSLIDMSEKPPEFKLSTISKTEGLEALEAVRGKD